MSKVRGCLRPWCGLERPCVDCRPPGTSEEGEGEGEEGEKAGDRYSKARKVEEQAAWFLGLVREAQRPGWFGVITAKVEDGIIKRATVEESRKPP